jgi:predicted transcriptional regulator of viral defense system
MVYQDFRNAFVDQICFTSNQVYVWHPDFDKNNLSRWLKKNYLIKLRNGFYTFREFLNTPNLNLYLANRIYRPSCVSLQTALAFYELIPEAVAAITSISTLKTTGFSNDLGSFSYKKLNNRLFFGFDHLPFLRDRTILMASPEKALLDLLYLYPFYNSEADMLDLRLNTNMLQEVIRINLLRELLKNFKNKALEKRTALLLKCYEL